MFDAGNWSYPVTEVTTDLLPVKRGDPGRSVIPISIDMVDVPEALCDFGSSVNIIPMVLYEKFFTYSLLETTMCLQFADQALSFPKRILKNLCVRVGTLYALADFGVIETGNDERGPIILGRPFLELSSTPVLPRSVSTSKGERRHFPSRTRLHKSQSNLDMNQGRGPTGGTRTSKCGPSQLRWSLQFKEVKIIDLSHRF